MSLIFDEDLEEYNELLEGEKIEMKISANALMGNQKNNTIRVIGWVKRPSFTILIDGGSTHNFIDPHAVTRSGCAQEPTKAMVVSVANGS